jgi:nitronate monooxygenase
VPTRVDPADESGWTRASRPDAARAGGALAGWQVGSVGEAKRAADAGCDLVVTQAVRRAADGEATVLTEVFAVGWPDAPHRVLRSALEAAEAFPGEVVGRLHAGPVSEPLPRLLARTPSREVTGTVAAMALYAGQGVGQVTEVTPAAQVVADLAQDTARLLRP